MQVKHKDLKGSTRILSERAGMLDTYLRHTKTDWNVITVHDKSREFYNCRTVNWTEGQQTTN